MSRLFAHLAFYPSLLWNMFNGRWIGRWNWWDEVDPGLIVGAFPFRSDAQRMHDAGIRAVVNTCEEYAGPQQEYARLGIDQFRMPTVDFTPPQLADIEQALEYIEQQRAAGHTVYIHCKAGRGRSATVAMCWLIRKYGMTPDEAQQHLQSHRQQVLKSLSRRQVVQDFYAKQVAQAAS